MSKNSSINLDKRAKRTREISIRVNDYELTELKKRNRGTRHVNIEKQVDAQVLHEIKAIREQMHLLIESSIEASKKSARENHDS